MTLLCWFLESKTLFYSRVRVNYFVRCYTQFTRSKYSIHVVGIFYVHFGKYAADLDNILYAKITFEVV